MTVHHCPPWCHECPDIEAIVRSQGREPDALDIMPRCHNGGEWGIDACICSHDDPHLDADTLARANWFADEWLRTVAERGRTAANDEVGKRRRAKRAG